MITQARKTPFSPKTETMPGELRARRSVLGVCTFFFLLAYAVICIFPFLWAFFVSIVPLNFIGTDKVQHGVDVTLWPPLINLIKGTAFGAPISFQNYFEIFKLVPLFSRWILNTVVFASIVTLGNLFFDTLAAYAFARLKFPLREMWFTLFLATMMVPFHVTMIPMYTMMVQFNLVNTYAGLFIPKLISVGIVFFMRQFFLDFPKSLEEAAYLDGANPIQIFFKVVIPNARAAIAAQAIYLFLGSWNEFMWPLIITSRKEMYTLTMGLAFFRSSFYTYWQYMMAASLLVTVPMVLIFLLFQRQFIGNQLSGAVKG